MIVCSALHGRVVCASELIESLHGRVVIAVGRSLAAAGKQKKKKMNEWRSVDGVLFRTVVIVCSSAELAMGVASSIVIHVKWIFIVLCRNLCWFFCFLSRTPRHIGPSGRFACDHATVFEEYELDAKVKFKIQKQYS